MTTRHNERRDFLKLGIAASASAAAFRFSTTAGEAAPLDLLAPLWPVPDRNNRAPGSTPPLAFRVFHKLAFGPKPGDIQSFLALGANDDARLQNWLDLQLAPTGVDPGVDSRLSAANNFVTLDKTLTQLWNDHYRNPLSPEYLYSKRPFWETQLGTLTRMVHSQWQLREVLADFWHNHFNVDGEEDVVKSILTDYDENVIRPHLFGNFRQMLEANARSTAMLYYLDNRANATPFPNENYAREILELHTVGAVENYFGFTPPQNVPLNIDGVPKGYVEADVIELARVLTGWGVADGDDGAPDTGTFLFRPQWHDNGTKTVMGQTIVPTNPPENEVLDFLDFLASHRGTAEFICWKLATRLIADGYTAADQLIQQAADVFQNNWQAQNQLELVYRTLLTSNDFKTRWAEKAKRPLEIVVAALRAAGAADDPDFVLQLDNPGADSYPFGYLDDLERTGQAPHATPPPTGYPEDRAIWQGSGPLVMSWRTITRMIRDTDTASINSHFINVAAQTNTGLPLAADRTPVNIVAYWLDRVLGPGFVFDPAKRGKLEAFVAQGGAPASPLNVDTTDTTGNSAYQRRIRTLVGLITMLPEVTVR